MWTLVAVNWGGCEEEIAGQTESWKMAEAGSSGETPNRRESAPFPVNRRNVGQEGCGGAKKRLLRDASLRQPGKGVIWVKDIADELSDTCSPRVRSGIIGAESNDAATP
jgi:hypothetical protein